MYCVTASDSEHCRRPVSSASCSDHWSRRSQHPADDAADWSNDTVSESRNYWHAASRHCLHFRHHDERLFCQTTAACTWLC